MASIPGLHPAPVLRPEPIKFIIPVRPDALVVLQMDVLHAQLAAGLEEATGTASHQAEALAKQASRLKAQEGQLAELQLQLVADQQKLETLQAGYAHHRAADQVLADWLQASCMSACCDVKLCLACSRYKRPVRLLTAVTPKVFGPPAHETNSNQVICISWFSIHP